MVILKKVTQKLVRIVRTFLGTQKPKVQYSYSFDQFYIIRQ